MIYNLDAVAYECLLLGLFTINEAPADKEIGPYYISRVQGQQCGGVQIHITDRERVDLTSIQFHIMDVVQSLYPQQRLFGNQRDRMFDKVCGTDKMRKMFLEGTPIGQVIRFWNGGRGPYMKMRAKYLLYE